MKSCLDRIRELYAEYTPQEIASAIGQYRKEEELARAEQELSTKVLHFEEQLAVVKKQRKALAVGRDIR